MKLSSSLVEFEDVGLAWNRVGSFARGGSRTGGRQLDGTTEKEEEDDDDELELLKKMGLPSAFGKANNDDGLKKKKKNKEEPVDSMGMQHDAENDVSDEWQQGFDDATGFYYYYNEKLQKSQWKMPKCGFRALPGGHLLREFDEIYLGNGCKGDSAGEAQGDGENKMVLMSHVLDPPPVGKSSSKGNEKASLLGNVLVKPRMESSGIMDEMLLPQGIHTRFEDEEEEPSSERLHGDVNLEYSDTPDADIVKSPESGSKIQLKKHRRNRRRRIKSMNMTCAESNAGNFVQSNPLKKYWLQRYSLFSEFDKGVILDDESWYSVTPEIIAWHQAMRIARCYGSQCLVVDAFGGAGGNTIQLALAGLQVISIDISQNKTFIIRQNATVYGVQNLIDVLCGDFTVVSPSIHADVVFLSPPWGGPEYSQNDVFDVDDMGGNPHLGLGRLIHISCIHMKASSVVAWLPRNTDRDQVKSVIGCSPLHSSAAHIEEACVNGVSKGITVYIGILAEYLSKCNP